MLRLADAGRLRRGAHADLLVIPKAADDPGTALLRTARSDIQLTVVGGRPVVGAPELTSAFHAARVQAEPVLIDGVLRLADAKVADSIARSSIREPGVRCA
jgi:cytosine/adenosine deaminase-related metal-dependent hydrolase